MNESESELTYENLSLALDSSGNNFVLLKAGTHFAYYRIEHDGKQFFFKTYSNDSSFTRKLLRREYELSAGLQHPNIATALLFGSFAAGRDGILMEYVDGRTLTEFLAENPSKAQKRKIFAEILDAVGYLHKKGIIHNDLKPDNILISNQGDTLRLIDLGLSDDDAHYLIKTPGFSSDYAAPELKENRRSDTRSDVFSLGLLMKLLFQNRYRHIRRRCTLSNPKRRYRDAEALAASWQRRNRPFKFAALLCTLIVLAGAGFLIGQEQQEMKRIVSAQQMERQSQTRAYNKLKLTYDELKDSIRIAEEQKKAHSDAVNGKIKDFRKGIDKMYKTYLHNLKACTSLKDMIVLKDGYITQIREYYSNYEKTADGEDLSPILYPILIDVLEKSDADFASALNNLKFN